MDANRFYSIPYDARNDTAMLKLRNKQGGIIAFGRWQALLGMLFDEGGIIDINDPEDKKVIEKEIELKGIKFDTFIETCIGYGLLSYEMWTFGKIASDGVIREIEFKAKLKLQKSEAGKKGQEAKRAKEEAEKNAADGAGA